MKPTATERDNLVDELAAARHRADVSQMDIARRARVSKSLIQRIEGHERSPKPHVLRAYAALIGLDADELLLKFGYMPADVFSRIQANPQLCQMVRMA